MSDSDNEIDGSAPTPGIRSATKRPEDTIRILLATDNHIGYMERDPIRGQDSINTFKEILQLAVKHEVDFILLAGDLFHENKPSRDSLYKTIALLREYTMGEQPIQVELLSDPQEGKAPGFTFPAVNYEDPNFNVGIPVFSIHGNHDDPQGAGAEGALCALDILSVSGLLNYMGKIDLPVSDAEAPTTGLAVHPVLLRKGETYMGMYGIGNVKDARMHFELRSNRVRMFMPRDKDSWFNVFLIHQNRIKHGPQEFVPEGMFDDSIDLVVWGHEHDCKIVPEPVAGKKYYITQPGSSVATSLADGESIPKKVALLEVQGKEFDLTPIPLRTVRPFVLKEIVLNEVADKEGLNIDDTMEVTKYLKTQVNTLIDEANRQWDERNAAAVEKGEESLPRMLPLVRLKVDTTGVSSTSNPIRFGQDFSGKVANPRDLLVFHRSKKAAAARNAKVKADEPELSIDDPDMSVSEKLAKVRVGTLVKEYLAAQELQLLGEGGMSDAIRLYVEKDDKDAIQTHVTRALNRLMKSVESNEDLGEEELEELLAKAKEQQDKEYEERAKGKTTKGKDKGKGKDDEDEDDDNDDAASVDSMMIDDMGAAGESEFDQLYSDDAPPPPKKTTGRAKAPAKKAPAKAAPKKKAPARGRAKKAATPESDEDEIIEIPDDDDDEEEEEAPKPVKRTNRAAILSQPVPKKAPAKRGVAASSQRQSQLNFAPAGRNSTRAAATKARGRMVVDDDDSD